MMTPEALAAASSAPSTAWAYAERLTAELETDEARLRLRHNHLRVIGAWRRVQAQAQDNSVRRAAGHQLVAAWNRLAHWSGLAADAAKAATVAQRIEGSSRSAPAPSAREEKRMPSSARSALLESIVQDVRESYPDVRIEPKTMKQDRLSKRSSVASKRARRPFVIVLDAGHGGRDHGATGVRGLKEKDVNLALVRDLGRRLQRTDAVRVVYTRTTDRFVSLDQRIRSAHRAGADLFLSVHANAHRDKRISGVETYFVRGARAMGSPSWKLAATIQAQTIRSLRKQHPIVRSLGTKAGGFRVLRGVRMPAVLIESGFITHEAEANRLRRTSYRRLLVEGIAKGVQDFIDRAANSLRHPTPGRSASSARKFNTASHQKLSVAKMVESVQSGT